MKLKKGRIIWIVLGVVVVAIVLVLVLKNKGDDKKNKRATVKVEKRNIIEKALAVGTIDPETEIEVKSKISGVVKKLFIDAGSYVKANSPMLEIRPDPTPLELAEAKRNVEMADISLTNSESEFNRLKQLQEKGLISETQFENSQMNFQEAKLRQEMALERLALLEKGKITIANTAIETVIKSPTDGFVLEKLIDVGDPIVPLTSYQAGTVMFTIADMNRLLFKGTVDEIDVGKLVEGMKAEIQVGALPGKPVQGVLSKISLKARKEDNTTVFPVEILVHLDEDQVLRAGYSANANIIIQQKDSVLAIPERTITFRNDSAFVQIQEGVQGHKEVAIQTGLSDAIYIEVVSGLKLDQEVLEKEVQVIK